MKSSAQETVVIDLKILCIQETESRTAGTKGLLQFSSVAQSYPTLCDPMNCSTPGFAVLHHLPEFAQTRPRSHEDSPPSHPRLPPPPPALNLSQHQGLSQRALIRCTLSYLWHAGPLVACGMWDPAPGPGIEPRPPALRVWSHSLWTTREVPVQLHLDLPLSSAL